MKNKVLCSIIVLTLICIMLILTGCGKSNYESIEVYIEDGMSESRVLELEDKIKKISNVQSIQYTSKADAFKKALEKFEDSDVNNKLLEQYTERNHPFPASFTVEIKKDKNYEDTIKKIENFDGVSEITRLK